MTATDHLVGRLAELAAAPATASAEEISALWDSLEPVTTGDLAGHRWKGTGIDTGHPLFGVLESSRWWGKDFTDPAKVDPILVTDDAGQVVPDTSATGGGGAGLWEVTFRSRPTASMVYDKLPVIDHFSAAPGDREFLLGVMNGRGTLHEGEHFWFVLRRHGAVE